MSKVIITGANGFLGSNLVRKIVDCNNEVVALDISFKNNHLPDSKLIKTIETDLTNIDELYDILKDAEYDSFYHLAWKGVNGLDKADPIVQSNNIKMVLDCAVLAKKLNVKKYLCAGTIAERATESLTNLTITSGGMMYGVAKHCAHLMLESYCKNVGLNFVWMQFSNIYGPSNKTGNLVSYTLGQLNKNEEATFGPALQPYDFIYVDDLIEAVFRLGEKDTKQNCYFIGSGEPRQLKDYLLEIGRLYGRENLIKIGLKPDDGIKYTLDMFDTNSLKEDIGNYTSKNFTEGIKYTLENY